MVFRVGIIRGFPGNSVACHKAWLNTYATTMRIARIWGSRRLRQQAGRLLSLHQAEVRFDRFLDSVACIIATQWQRRRVVLLYGQLHCVCNRIRGFPSCLSG